MKKFLLSLLIVFVMGNLLLCSKSYAQMDRAGYIGMIESFLNQVKQNKASQALDDLFSETPWQSKNAQKIASAKESFSRLNVEGGALLDFQNVANSNFGERYNVISYYLYYDNKPAAVSFAVYKPKTDWLLYSVYVNENIGTDMEKSLFNRMFD